MSLTYVVYIAAPAHINMERDRDRDRIPSTEVSAR